MLRKRPPPNSHSPPKAAIKSILVELSHTYTSDLGWESRSVRGRKNEQSKTWLWNPHLQDLDHRPHDDASSQDFSLKAYWKSLLGCAVDKWESLYLNSSPLSLQIPTTLPASRTTNHPVEQERYQEKSHSWLSTQAQLAIKFGQFPTCPRHPKSLHVSPSPPLLPTFKSPLSITKNAVSACLLTSLTTSSFTSLSLV